MRFVQGRSYVWLFFVFAGMFFAANFLSLRAGKFGWGIVVMPLFLAFITLSEWWSGVAFDSWWRAQYPRGTWQYKAILAWHVFSVIAFSAMSYVMIVH